MAIQGGGKAETSALYESWKQRLKSNWDLMNDSLEIDQVLDFLVSKKAITEREMKSIREQSPRREQIYHLLGIIQDGSYRKVELFVEALNHSGQTLLASNVTGR